MPAAFSGSLKTTLNKTSHHGRSTDARLVAAQISAPNPAQRVHKTYKTTASLPTRLNLDHFHLFLMTTNQNSHPSALNHLEQTPCETQVSPFRNFVWCTHVLHATSWVICTYADQSGAAYQPDCCFVFAPTFRSFNLATCIDKRRGKAPFETHHECFASEHMFGK